VRLVWAALSGKRSLGGVSELGLIAIASVMVALACPGMAEAACPGGRALTVAQVDGFLGSQIPDDRIVELIGSCHVGFSMNAATLDHFSAEAVSAKVWEALNRDTASQQTLPEARAEVAALESRVMGSDAGQATDRDAALAKLDAGYQAQRAQAAKIDPRGEFERTADYQARVQQSQVAQVQIEDRHQVERRQLIGRFNKPLEDRIQILRQGLYPVAETATERHYDPDLARLTVMLHGEEYWFDSVQPENAKALFARWDEVRVAQPYSDRTNDERALVVRGADGMAVTPPGVITGMSARMIATAREAQVAGDLRRAKALMDAKNYAGAQAAYSQILARNPGNLAAQQGMAAAQQGIRELALLPQKQRAEGYWVDPRTGLGWTAQDNGAAVNWKHAGEYCQQLRTGGFADWKLPSVEQLKALYDGGSTRQSVPTGKLELWAILRQDGGNVSQTEMQADAGTVYKYHIAGGIVLSGRYVWSDEDRRIGIIHARAVMEFSDASAGDHVRVIYERDVAARALCVRGPQ